MTSELSSFDWFLLHSLSVPVHIQIKSYRVIAKVYFIALRNSSALSNPKSQDYPLVCETTSCIFSASEN